MNNKNKKSINKKNVMIFFIFHKYEQQFTSYFGLTKNCSLGLFYGLRHYLKSVDLHR